MADQEATESALTAFWRYPTPQTASAYLRLLLPVVRALRASEARAPSAYGADDPGDWTGPDQVGPYVLGELLGSGAEGLVFRARHVQDGVEVALKLNSRGDSVLAEVLGDDWPPMLVRTLAAGLHEGVPWIVRELADETLHDFMHHTAPCALSIDQVLEVFDIACRGVAALHSRRIFGWSAHSKNVYRVDGQWRLGDFGRVWVLVDELDQRQRDLYALMGFDGDQADDPFGAWDACGYLVFDPEREHRLRLDDCSMLAGLLAQLVSGRRWQWFFLALNRQPFCSATYSLTGNKDVDRLLSQVINRAWRGSDGGAPLAANDGRGETTTYTDALELLADVSSVLGSSKMNAVPCR